MAAQLIVCLSLALLVAAVSAAAPKCTGSAATACTNKNGDAFCNSTFGASNATAQSPNCTDTVNAVVVKGCLKQCWMCCEDPAYSCTDGTTVNCTEALLANLCQSTDAATKAVMTGECKATCGLCASGGCADTDPNCAIITNQGALCRDIAFYQTFSVSCKATCKLCDSTAATTVAPGSGSGCVDLATNCVVNAALCTNPSYQSLMASKCPKTCGLCSSTGSGGSTGACSDVNSNCATWVRNGFCTNAGYTAAQKKQFCPRSCNLC